MTKETKALLEELRAMGVKSAEFETRDRGAMNEPFTSLIAVEFFDTLPAPPSSAMNEAQLDEVLGLNPVEPKPEGICAWRGCDEANGGAMNGALAPEFCRAHALQAGGVRG